MSSILSELNYTDELVLSKYASKAIQDLKIQFPSVENDASNIKNRCFKFTNNLELQQGFTDFLATVPRNHLYNLDDNSRKFAIYNSKDLIMHNINIGKTVAFLGGESYQKSIAIPHYILDESALYRKSCLILVCRQNALLAMDAAEQMSTERKEEIGETIGYKVINQNVFSLKTNVVFCTPEIVLHTLAMKNSNFFSNVTHIILDDLNMRDMYMEISMIGLREMLFKHPDLKLILNVNINNSKLFADYFHCSNIVVLPNFKKFESSSNTKNYFLEDILSTGNVKWSGAEALMAEHEKREILGLGSLKSLDENIRRLIDKRLFEAWCTGDDKHFDIMLKILSCTKINVNYAHPFSSLTPLMISAAKGKCNTLRDLLNMGADVRICSNNGWTALDWAVKNHHKKSIEVLEKVLPCEALPEKSDVELVEEFKDFQPLQKQMLASYFAGRSEEIIDYFLISVLIENEILSNETGSIVIFLPGLDDMVHVLEKLESGKLRTKIQSDFAVFTLHEEVISDFPSKCFNISKRLLIFSTSLFEHALSLENVVAVIDSGRERVLYFNHLNGRSQLEDHWIGKDSSVQRSLLCNSESSTCYRLYTKCRFENFSASRSAQIIKKPLDKICLWIKLLAPEGMTVENYFDAAPEPPRPFAVKVSLAFLKALEALTTQNDLTDLGFLLIQLPVEPKLGKLVLLSIPFKCTDPIITIASALEVQNVLVQPVDKHHRMRLLNRRNSFSQQTFSDHGVILKAMQCWLKSKEKENNDIDTGFLNCGKCELAFNIRSQLLTALEKLGYIKYSGDHYDLKDVNVYSDNFSIIRSVLCSAFFPNILKVNWERRCIMSFVDNVISISKHSILREIIGKKMTEVSSTLVPSCWFIYSQSKKLLQKTEVSDVSCISPLSVSLFAGPTFIPCRIEKVFSPVDDSNIYLYKIISWINFKTKQCDAELLTYLRRRIQLMMANCFKSPSFYKPENDATLACVSTILRDEDKSIGLRLLSGCAQKVKLQSSSFVSICTAFPANRIRVVCHFCDEANDMFPVNCKNNSCLQKKCIDKEILMQSKMKRKDVNDETKHKKTKLNVASDQESHSTRSEDSNEDKQTSLLGPLPSSSSSSDLQSRPDQLTQNLLTALIGSPYFLSPGNQNVNSFLFQNQAYTAAYIQSLLSNNEYVNPVSNTNFISNYESNESICQSNSSSSIAQNFKQLKATDLLKVAKNDYIRFESSYTLPSGLEKIWNCDNPIPRWMNAEDSCLFFNKTWNFKKKSSSYCPWIDEGALDLVQMKLIYPPIGVPLILSSEYAQEHTKQKPVKYKVPTSLDRFHLGFDIRTENLEGKPNKENVDLWKHNSIKLYCQSY